MPRFITVACFAVRHCRRRADYVAASARLDAHGGRDGLAGLAGGA